MFSRRFLRIKVVKSLYAHFRSESDSVASSEKNLVNSIDKAYDLYYQMLELIVDVRRYAEDRIEIARNKKLPTAEDLNPNRRFLDNRAIVQIESCKTLNDKLTRQSLGWNRYPELIKHLFNKMTSSRYYETYMNIPEPDYRDDARLVQDFYIETVQDDELLQSVVEEQSIMWMDDVDFTLIMVVKTIEQSRQGQEELPLQRQYKSKDDEAFAKELFRKTVLNMNEYQDYIAQFTQNWDVERIAFIDNLILATATAELIGFDSIPVKVTMDEYIEISKYYSTPGSSTFVNGVLDRIVKSLTDEGRIVKKGRGLLQ